MTEAAKTIQIDGNEYNVDTFTDKQKLLFNHCADLENQVNTAAFRLQQLQVSRDAFVGLLKAELTTPEVAAVPS
jgi:hypothetical protein